MIKYKMSELWEIYVIELNILFRNEKTKYQYKMALKKFISENSRCYRMSENDLKKYFSEFRNKYSDSYYNVICSTVKIFYERVLKQSKKMGWFKPIKTDKQFHDIIKDEEFVQIMKNIKNIKHKFFVILFYSTGIRIGELLNIKISDVNILNQTIFINTEKNGKNRYVPIHDLTLRYLKVYLKEWNPKIYLFEGQNGGKYSATSIRNVINKASKNINKNIYPHLFRHTLISKTIEKENVFLTMELAGHKNLNSTLHYNHIPMDKLKEMYNPLNSINI